MATIKDVADKANVSIATVSRVLNGTSYVSPELNWRVREAIDALGYRPNVLARQLRRSESLTLGVLIPDSSNPYFAELAKGIEDVCFEHGFTVVLCNTAENANKAATYIKTLYAQRVAGFVIVTTREIGPQLQELLDKKHPIIIADRALPNFEADMVVSDNYGGAQDAIKHLLELGHRRIGVVIGNLNLETFRRRWAGTQDALRAAGIIQPPTFIYDQGDYLPQTGYAGARKFLEQPDPPSAIFAFNDLMALGVLNYAQTHGFKVPEELSVIGFDDIVMASYTVPALTTIAQPKYELGRRVAELLLNRVEGDTQMPIRLTLPTQLIVRGSTAPCTRRLI